jgi:hypothetical protein
MGHGSLVVLARPLDIGDHVHEIVPTHTASILLSPSCQFKRTLSNDPTDLHQQQEAPCPVLAAIDASTEDPGGGIIGKVLYCHPSKAEVLLFELDYKATELNPRTRIVNLRVPLPVDSQVNGQADVAPMDS